MNIQPIDLAVSLPSGTHQTTAPGVFGARVCDPQHVASKAHVENSFHLPIESECSGSQTRAPGALRAFAHSLVSHVCLVALLIETVFLCISSARAADASDPFTGQIMIHDPSTIVQDHGRYYIFGTKAGICARSSTDLLAWRMEPPVFSEIPAWTRKVAPGFDGNFWAPDVIHLNGKYYLYYAVSAWGKQTSAIGLATSPTLDSTATNYAWTDAGPVIESTKSSPFNTIDPSVMQDTDGSLWMAFGSYWKGIYLARLDATTGLRSDTNLYHLAWNDSIEATCLIHHGGSYYLFVNWGQCCRGTNSTYDVRIGRSDKITGPYLDKMGSDLAAGGGSEFLHTEGRYVGPGHIGLLQMGGEDWISFHTYDAFYKGKSRLFIRHLDWTADGWPVAGKTFAGLK